MPCNASPTAKSRWITWSCRSRAIRSRSVSTSSSRIRCCELASCQANAAWSANAAIMSSCSSLKGTELPSAQHDNDTGDRFGGPQRQHERRARQPSTPSSSTRSTRRGVRLAKTSPTAVPATAIVCPAVEPLRCRLFR